MSEQECDSCGGTGEIVGLPFGGQSRTMPCPFCVQREVNVLTTAFDLFVDATVARCDSVAEQDVRSDAAKAMASAAKAEIAGLLRKSESPASNRSTNG